MSTFNGPFYLDIDLDYFTYYTNREEKLGSLIMINSKLILEHLI